MELSPIAQKLALAEERERTGVPALTDHSNEQELADVGIVSDAQHQANEAMTLEIAQRDALRLANVREQIAKFISG